MADEHPEDDRPEGAELRKDAKRRTSEASRGDRYADDPAPEHGYDDPPKTEEGAKPGRLYRLGRRLLNSGDDVRELASAVLDSSDRAKTEMVRMVAREVRNYLDELKIKDDVKDLVTKHSLEMHVSFSLKPLVEGKGEGAKKPDGNG
jgi:hypothetical protein